MTKFTAGIQVLLVLLVCDDLTTICFDLLLLVVLPRLSDKALLLTVPIKNTRSLMISSGTYDLPDISKKRREGHSESNQVFTISLCFCVG